MSNSKKLRDLIYSPSLEFIMEAHNGLSARIAKEAGFKAIWASGLSMSASEGVRDNNELSFTEVAKRCEVICSAVPDIPVLLDFDSGYGSFNTATVALRHMIRSGIAGLVIEDKKFPKLRNSLHEHSEDDELADIEEHSLKIKALREEANKHDRDFIIVARLESFLANKGLDDALARAESYVESGADAILVHSKKSTSEEIDLFMSKWKNKVPVIIVPTKYYKTPSSHFEEIGVSAVIWANHQMRACITAMQSVTRSIYENRSLVEVEGKIASVSEVFRLQNNKELEDREKLYLPREGKDISVIILAATRGSRSLYPLTQLYPKCMIPIGMERESSIERHVRILESKGVDDIVIVGGYQSQSLKKRFAHDLRVKVCTNYDYDSTTELESTLIALREKLYHRKVLVIYGDCLYDEFIYEKVFSQMKPLPQGNVLYTYTNRINKDWLDQEEYFAGIIGTDIKKLGEIVSSFDDITQYLLEEEISSSQSIKVSIPRDSMIDINSIDDFNEGIKFL